MRKLIRTNNSYNKLTWNEHKLKLHNEKVLKFLYVKLSYTSIQDLVVNHLYHQVQGSFRTVTSECVCYVQTTTISLKAVTAMDTVYCSVRVEYLNLKFRLQRFKTVSPSPVNCTTKRTPPDYQKVTQSRHVDKRSMYRSTHKSRSQRLVTVGRLWTDARHSNK